MPIQISLCDALESGEFDRLLPTDFQAFVQRIQVDIEDEAPWKVFADWLHEQEEFDLEFAIRWCVARHLVPIHEKDRYGHQILWRWAQWWHDADKRYARAMPPGEVRSWLDDCQSETLMGLMAKTAKALLEKQRELFGTDERPMPAHPGDCMCNDCLPTPKHPPTGDDEKDPDPRPDEGAPVANLVELPVSAELQEV